MSATAAEPDAPGAAADGGAGGAHPLWNADGPDLVITGDNLEVLPQLPDGAFTLVYLDPPFNTGRSQKRARTSNVRSATGTGDAQRADQFGVSEQRYAAAEQQQLGQAVKVGGFGIVACTLGE